MLKSKKPLVDASPDLYRVAAFHGAFNAAMVAEGICVTRSKLAAGVRVPLIMDVPLASILRADLSAEELNALPALHGGYMTTGFYVEGLIKSGRDEVRGIESLIRNSKRLLGGDR